MDKENAYNGSPMTTPMGTKLKLGAKEQEKKGDRLALLRAKVAHARHLEIKAAQKREYAMDALREEIDLEESGDGASNELTAQREALARRLEAFQKGTAAAADDDDDESDEEEGSTADDGFYDANEDAAAAAAAASSSARAAEDAVQLRVGVLAFGTTVEDLPEAPIVVEDAEAHVSLDLGEFEQTALDAAAAARPVNAYSLGTSPSAPASPFRASRRGPAVDDALRRRWMVTIAEPIVLSQLMLQQERAWSKFGANPTAVYLEEEPSCTARPFHAPYRPNVLLPGTAAAENASLVENQIRSGLTRVHRGLDRRNFFTKKKHTGDSPLSKKTRSAYDSSVDVQEPPTTGLWCPHDDTAEVEDPTETEMAALEADLAGAPAADAGPDWLQAAFGN